MPPRRRAFRSNDFGLEPTTIPLDASRLAEPPSRQGTLFRQNHFHFNPSRMLVGHYSRYAANNAQPRLMVLLRRDFPAHRPITGVAALPIAKQKARPLRGRFNHIVIFHSDVFRRNTLLCKPTRPCGVEQQHREPLAAREPASKMHETCSPRKGDVGKMWRLSQSGAIMYITTNIFCIFAASKLPKNECNDSLSG